MSVGNPNAENFMNIKTKILVTGLGLAMCTTALAGKNTKVYNMYDCQVQTSSQIFGLVMVEAETRKKAIDIAARAKAITVKDTRESVEHVIQCVQLPDETFNDKAFGLFASSYPR